MSPWERLHEAPARHEDAPDPDRPMVVRLYPNEPGQDAACGPDGIVTGALVDALEQLRDYRATDYWRIDRYADGYPRMDPDAEFLQAYVDWLHDGNPTGRDLTAFVGVHLDVHGYPCDRVLANAEYADDCDHPSAFVRGVAAWTGTACEPGLVRNSAIQETLHEFVRYRFRFTKELTDGGFNPLAEHALGAVEDGLVSPMLTYHVEEYRDRGVCTGDGSTPTGWTATLTDCTKEAVLRTGLNPCEGDG